jgi:hypothetical protein
VAEKDVKPENKGVAEKDVKPENKGASLLARMLRNTPAHIVEWPGIVLDGKPVRVRLRYVTETLDCYADATAEFAKRKIPIDSLATADKYEEEIVVQVLARACCDPDEPDRPLALDAQDLRLSTTPAQRAAMLDLYMAFARAVDLPSESLTPDAEAAIADAVKKKDVEALRRFGSFMLATYMLTSGAPPSS